MIPVNSYGLHRTDGGLWFLEEPNKSTTIVNGISSPFKVVDVDRCDHAFELDYPPPPEVHIKEFKVIEQDPLIKFIDLVPQETRQIIFLPMQGILPANMLWAEKIAHFTWDRLGVFYNKSSLEISTLKKFLKRSNLKVTMVGPFMAPDMKKLNQVAELGLTPGYSGKLIILGDPSISLPPFIKRESSPLWNSVPPILDWRALGIYRLRKVMGYG